MARAYRCDRCKKFYTDNKHLFNGIVYNHIIAVSKTGKSEICVDLCDDCMKDFFGSFMGGNKNE